MKIRSISFSNFKYATKEKKVKLDLLNAESLILGGPNGYGKTTVFDALELLITGEIRHFNPDLPNRGKESISVLANDKNSDIYVAAEFINGDQIILAERKFVHDKNFDSLLMLNHELINNDRLYSILGINKNLFELGIYISQIDSLNFLQQKYKTRKESIIGILDNSYIESRFDEFRRIQELLKSKFEQEEKNDRSKLADLDREKVKIEEALKALQLSQEDIPYIRLFESKEYNFDKEFFNQEENYDVVISPINDLIEFCKYRKAFLIKKRNTEVKNIISIDKKIYTALFFNKEISKCIENKKIIDVSNEFIKLKESCQQKQFYLNENIIKTLELTDENVQQINELLADKISIEKGMTDTQSSLSKILKQRADFLTSYDASVEESILPDKMCPLCGRKTEELKKLFFETEMVLKSNLGLIATQLSDVIQKLTDVFGLFVIEKIDIFLNSHKQLIETNNVLLSFMQISTVKLSEELKKENIVFLNTSECVDFNLFEEKYSETIKNLNLRLKEETEVITEELYIKLLRISLEYYSNIEPHDEQALFKKKFYISALFSNSLNIKFKESESEYNALDKKIKNRKSRYDDVFENITTITRKYADAKKQYQSSIAINIAVPMFIFSGKIIQNYPLGLGILIQVENNAVVFKTGNIDTDIFNNLSTGQLNGVVISLLLSIKEIFTTSNSLNVLLIDDPLQTIDEISTISLIDLLSEHFGDTQILLSTHEDDKQFLLKKKYEQSDKRCKVINMQREYLIQ